MCFEHQQSGSPESGRQKAGMGLSESSAYLACMGSSPSTPNWLVTCTCDLSTWAEIQGLPQLPVGPSLCQAIALPQRREAGEAKRLRK